MLEQASLNPISNPENAEETGAFHVNGYEEVNCLICESPRRNLKFRKIHMGHPIFVQQCLDCGFLYYSPRPTVRMFDEIYKDEYFSRFVPDYSQKAIFESKNFAETCRIKKILQFNPPSRDRLLEIGPGFGYQLLAAKDHFKEVMGIELNHQAAEHCRSLGFKIFEKDVTECEIPENSLDVVVMYTVIEHLLQPKLILGKIRQWLKPGGLFIAQTCNADSLYCRSQGADSHAICIDHICFFNDKTLNLLYEKCGFEVLKTFYNRGLTYSEERRYAEIQTIAPLREQNPEQAGKLARKLNWLCWLRSLRLGRYTLNITVTNVGRKPLSIL